MDEPSEVWEQPPAAPVPSQTSPRDDAMANEHRFAKEMGKKCHCDWCLKQRVVQNAIDKQTAEIEMLKHHVAAWTNYAAKLKNQTAEPVRQPTVAPPKIDRMWDLFEEEQKKDLAEVRQLRQELRQELRAVNEAQRKFQIERLYEWGELLWLPLFIGIVILSYLFP